MGWRAEFGKYTRCDSSWIQKQVIHIESKVILGYANYDHKNQRAVTLEFFIKSNFLRFNVSLIFENIF